MDPAQSIAQKTPPIVLEETLNGLKTLLLQSNNVDAYDALMKKYYIPFEHVIDSQEKGEKPFLACHYNKVSDNNNTTQPTYRSPWTNNLHAIAMNSNDNNTSESSSSSTTTTVPTSSTTTTPRRSKNEDMIRTIEKSFNDVWDSYKNLYYGHEAVGSVYMKDMDTTKGCAFQGLFGIRKRTATIGSWDSVSIVVVDEPLLDTKECTYRIDTYVRVVMTPTVGNNEESNNDNTADTATTTPTTCTDISVFMSKETVTTCKIYPDKIPINVSHIENIGTIIEDNEMEIRSVMETVYIPKNYETILAIQKMPLPQRQSNPVMGLMMDSGILKKRHNEQEQGGVVTSTAGSETTTATPPRRPMGIPQGTNPLMAGAMNSKILLKKRQQQQQEQDES